MTTFLTVFDVLLKLILNVFGSHPQRLPPWLPDPQPGASKILSTYLYIWHLESARFLFTNFPKLLRSFMFGKKIFLHLADCYNCFGLLPLNSKTELLILWHKVFEIVFNFFKFQL